MLQWWAQRAAAWTGISDWSARARSVTTGWCGTRTDFSNSNRRAATTRRLRARRRCAKGGTGASSSSIEGALPWREISAPARPSLCEVKPALGRAPERRAKRKWVPPAEHPWRQAIHRVVQKRASYGAAVTMRPISALPSASPQALRPSGSAGLRSGQGRQSAKEKNEKDDTSNEVRKGTFLRSFDRRFP